MYHRNRFEKGLDYREACNGDFHRQADVKATDSLDKLVEYIMAHDRAKVIIMDDYRKLPHSTKKQKQYYRAAERKDRRNAMRRLDSIFAALESRDAGLKKCSIC